MTQSQPEAQDSVTGLAIEARAGSARALEELLADHLPLLYNIIGRALGGGTDVDDVVQETLVRLIRGLPALREPERFRAWAVAIAYRQVQQHRRRGRAPVQPLDGQEPTDPHSDFAERAVAELALSGQRREVAEAARWLEPEERSLLSLWWMEAAGRLTRSELVHALGVPAPLAAVRVQRMRARLDDARAVVRALRATPRCPELAEVIRSWDGVPERLWRKRISRHLRGCARCGGRRRGLVPPEQLLLGVGLVPVPTALGGPGGLGVGGLGGHGALGAAMNGPALASPALAGAPGASSGFAGLAGRLGGGKAVAAVAVTALAAGGLGYARWDASRPRPRAATPPVAREVPDPATAVAGSSAAAPSVAATPSRSATPTARPGTPGAPGALTADLYVAPGGSDSGDGSLAHPFATLAAAAAVVGPGQTIALRGGVYRPKDTTTLATDGTTSARITVSNYRDEQPVIDGSDLPAGRWALVIRASNWTVQGLQVRNAPDHALVCLSCRGDVLQRLSVHDNGTGLTLRGDGTVGNQVLDSDFYDNHSADGSAGTGVSVVSGSGTGNLVRGCRAFGNAVEGFDLGGFADPVTLEDDWSFANDSNRWSTRTPRTGNGFTLGGGHTRLPVAHVLRDDAAWDNAGLGFNDEGNGGAIVLTGNTAYRNGSTGFFLPDAQVVARGNVAVANATDVVLGTSARSTGNTWNGSGTASAARFESTDPAPAEGRRRTDGRLPRTSFLVSRNGLGADMAE